MPTRRFAPELENLEPRKLLSTVSINPSVSPVAISGIQMQTSQRMPKIDMSEHHVDIQTPVITVQLPKRPNQSLPAMPTMQRTVHISYAPDWEKIDWSKPPEIFWNKITKQEWATVPANVLKKLPWKSIDPSIIKDLPWGKGMQGTMQECLPADVQKQCVSATTVTKPVEILHDEALEDLDMDDATDPDNVFDDALRTMRSDVEPESSTPAIASTVVLSAIALNNMSVSKPSPVDTVQADQPHQNTKSFLGRVGSFLSKLRRKR
ncbi:MAG: hypothetical protein KBD00_02550 [Candidatus Peribacteraceae bacterium]|nr:hypothetical protein [Candidatus Peribacteraceae bacterium]